MDELGSLYDADEDSLRTGFARTDLLPNQSRWAGKIGLGSGLLFNRTALLPTPDPNLKPIPAPNPDHHYAYKHSVFSGVQYGKATQPPQPIRRIDHSWLLPIFQCRIQVTLS
jgi:hypothetical protein